MEREFLPEFMLSAYSEIESFEKEMDNYSRKLLNIHCTLNDKIDDLIEFRTIQSELDELTTKFFVFDFNMEREFNEILTKYKSYSRRLKLNIFLSAIITLIPMVGLMLSIILFLSNLMRLKDAVQLLKKISKKRTELNNCSEIIKKNIEARYRLLETRLQEYATNTKKLKLKEKIELTYYCATQIISSYIDGYDVNVDELDSQIQSAIKYILQRELNVDDNNLNHLLKCIKEHDNQKDFCEQKRLIYQTFSKINN